MAPFPSLGAFILVSCSLRDLKVTTNSPSTTCLPVEGQDGEKVFTPGFPARVLGFTGIGTSWFPRLPRPSLGPRDKRLLPSAAQLCGWKWGFRETGQGRQGGRKGKCSSGSSLLLLRLASPA